MSMKSSERIIVALDVPSASNAVDLAKALRDHVGAVKVGLELTHAAGFGVFDELRAAGVERIFYDCKLHDIPNTVAGATRAIVSRGVWMMNVHASGGSRMMRASVDAAEDAARCASLQRPLIIAVTLLTSLTPLDLAVEMRVDSSTVDYVRQMAVLAKSSGCDGVVCSPQEIGTVRWACGPEFVIVTPGVRPHWADPGDQRRYMTPAEAVRAGADYLVIGRPITGAADPVMAATRVAEEMEAALEPG